LIYGVYFLFLAIGSILYFPLINFFIDNNVMPQFYDIYLIISILIKGLGGIFFSHPDRM